MLSKYPKFNILKFLFCNGITGILNYIAIIVILDHYNKKYVLKISKQNNQFKNVERLNCLESLCGKPNLICCCKAFKCSFTTGIEIMKCDLYSRALASEHTHQYQQPRKSPCSRDAMLL